jgi:hypothetical protein
MSLCRSTKVSFGSIGEASATSAASAVKKDERRNVLRSMIVSFRFEVWIDASSLVEKHRSGSGDDRPEDRRGDQ